ncbi:MAG: undecaprenyl/decaprenyl-phosphate alpha-N-acetylglucosaminyl 1-phosphate transferase [Candidatus Omnitrophica bacterium]|nr:undecaprenyl/decaprenyl-phosphate alpha-N-acetylglucosaminyl 1-phosphate transferase [Candidatus Omnitrophota bacterium]
MIAAYQHLWKVMLDFIAPFLFSFVLVVLLSPVMIFLARKYNVLDYPNERKMHKEPIPRLGGLGILVAFWIVSLFCLPLTKEYWAILLGATLIGVMGIVDDVRPLSSRIRLVGQLAAAAIVMAAGMTVSFMPKVWWGHFVSYLITFLWILGIVNAVNFFDGLDGLASGMVFIAAFFFVMLAIYLRQLDVALVGVVTAGCALGFLMWNSRPAKIYLGDGGSTLLGFLIACLALYGGWSNDGFIVAMGVPTIILGVLIFDMIYITLARIKGGQVRSFQQWLDYTGKDHFHHRLISLGFNEVSAVWFIYLVSFGLGLNVLVLERLRNPLPIVVQFVHAILVFIMIFLLMRAGRGIVDGTKK